VPGDTSAKNLVEDEGLNAGSGAAERDREPSARPPVERRIADPPSQAPPPERLIGPPEQGACTPGQEVASGEK
jgi:hypothetical protein